jgi:hypothetical protein
MASAFALTLGAVTPAAAATITPLSYVFDQHTDTGTHVYNDSGAAEIGSPPYAGGTELTDGVLGYAGWEIGLSEPWVGWTDALINIDFTFAAIENFTSVSVGTTQDTLIDVVLPDLKVFSSLNGVDWIERAALATTPDAANNHGTFDTGPHVFLTLANLNFNAPFVRLQVSNHGPNYGTFSFIDEVRFEGGAAVPEPATWATMLIGFFGAGSLLRRRTARVIRA